MILSFWLMPSESNFSSIVKLKCTSCGTEQGCDVQYMFFDRLDISTVILEIFVACFISEYRIHNLHSASEMANSTSANHFKTEKLDEHQLPLLLSQFPNQLTVCNTTQISTGSSYCSNWLMFHLQVFWYSFIFLITLS